MNETETPDNTALRDPEFWLFRHIPLGLVVPLGLLAALAGWTATILRAPLWAIILSGAAVLLLGAVPVRRRYPRNLAGMFGRAVAFRWRRTKPGRRDTARDAFDVPLPEGGSYGVRWDGKQLTTVVRIDPPPDAMTLLRRGSLSTDQVVPLTEIGKCLSQFDIRLDSIDVVSTGARTAEAGVVAQLYDRILGPLPAIAHRTVWLVLRLDPLANVEAVQSRGGGGTGALRTAIIATRRVANRLAALDISVSVLTSAEINGAVRTLTRGIALEDFTETPKCLVAGNAYLTSYEIGPELIGPRGFSEVWATPSLGTTVTVRLRPDGDKASRRDVETPITMAALVRFDTATAPEEPPVPGLRPLQGRQYRALLDSLPVRAGHGDDGVSDYHGPLAALEGIALPTAGCGQLIGADDLGQGIAVPLIGAGTRQLEVIGKLDLAQQVILRAIALGAHAIVHTDRPDAWTSMVGNVGTPQMLTLAPRAAGASYHPPHPSPSPVAIAPTATVVVFDGIPPTAITGGATIVHVRGPQDPPGQFDADVVLTQDPAAPNLITVRTSTAAATVNMVTTPDEMWYIGESLAAAR
ncbi:type VII secretion protein EccE [Nocardia panacis]|uniref:Type VII secretion protein EccE n=1 Tax=Nocardia panacis TaxID=2340916 RepID=A0A3A4K340_9NOCA|nr:type VII secretion protein EccE [Nocardia panacis]RJO72374.1 type VII secretion protein EccE [Nocardia panacis]